MKNVRFVIVLIAVHVCCVLIVGLAAWYRNRSTHRVSVLAAHLPPHGYLTLGIDVALLRQTGLLRAFTPPGGTYEADYEAFLEETGFDYQADLDYVLARFAPDRHFLLLRGRFDWPLLRRYAENHGGKCRNTFCELEGSSPERLISFFPLRHDVMALAVGPESGLAWMMAKPSPAGSPISSAPVWLRLFPASVPARNLPAQLAAALKPFLAAEELMIEAAPELRGLRLQVTVTCLTETHAVSLASEVRAASRLAEALVAFQHSPPSAELVRALAAGQIRSRGREVLAEWHFSPALVESILGLSR